MPDISAIMEPFFRKIGRTPLNIAPERGKELERQIFEELRWTMEAERGDPTRPFMADPPSKTITVQYSGLAAVWCVACYSVFLFDLLSELHRQNLAGQTIDIRPQMELLKPQLEYAEILRLQDTDWPDHLPTPKCNAGDPWDRINNVFFGAIAFILLHEIGHVSLRHQIILPAQMKISQEIDADTFAANWIFAKVGTPEQREFRILVVGVALAWLFLFEPKGGSAEHPPAKTRLECVASHFGATADSVSLEVVTHLLKALFFSGVAPPQFENSQEYFDWMVTLFRS